MKNAPQFSMITEQYDLDFPHYFDMLTKFGAFNEDGSYTVTTRETPRQWLSMMCNENILSAFAGNGKGFLAYKYGKLRMTKHFVENDYLLRTPNGNREIILKIGEKEYNLITDCENYKYTVYPGRTYFEGTIEDVRFKIRIFVPLEDGVECTNVYLWGKPNTSYRLLTGTEWCFADHKKRCLDGRFPEDMTFDFTEDCLVVHSNQVDHCPDMYGFTARVGIEPGEMKVVREPQLRQPGDYISHHVITEKTITTNEKGEGEDIIIFGLCQHDYRCLVDKYLYQNGVAAEYEKLDAYWKAAIERNYVTLPDKNTQHILNLWLKNQLRVTSFYNRFGYMGYRDIVQDAWGVGFVDWTRSKKMMKQALENMYTDGRCPRQFSVIDPNYLDKRDFCDSPMWLPITLNSYIKETGDFGFLDEQVGFYGVKETSSVKDHILRAFDYLWNNLASNGLILMRRGDWLDGLEGLDALGEATSVWGTIATYYAQNKLIEIFEQTGDTDLTEQLKKRNEHYKTVANTVGWNGKWYNYATINDTEIIGHCDNLEGRIFLLPQVWSIFAGIADEKKIESIKRWVSLYLSTPWGPQLNYPPFAATGEKYGRLKKQRPGTFANSAIYLHAASFKVFADVARGDMIEAYDTFTRLLPGHRDNPDSRRTGEPWTVGNVHYGIHHKNPGLNLYTWFSATPAWLIHGGFEEILGVHPDFHGITVTPCRLPDWDGYSYTKIWRGKRFDITFRRSDRDAIFVDRKQIEGNLITTEQDRAEVLVLYTVE